ncbi:synaptotagmin-11 isoform X3 [Chelonia mydas]|uniref:synaptotagmin-11 isoform X3 n=1 Tax=Chelonia mydas TaxID=8469 RepID=UPI0018A1D31C|nr:synaptotagmin-11 isoform X3 [Chelonia mydas]
MAEIASVRPGLDVPPIVAGLIGATVLVVSVSVTVFVWTCCHQQAEKKHKTPPYKFIHMLKGISIYPETLSNKKKIIRIRRDKNGTVKETGRGNLLVDAAEAGLVGSEKAPNGMNAAPCIDQLPIKVDYGDELSPDQSITPGGSKISSPSSPEEAVLLGTLTFSVDYNFPKKALVVTIQEAHGLPVMDEHTQGSDPYIKMTILPDKRHRVKTRVLRKTLDPIFDETFTFYGIPYSQLQDLVLHFLVLSFDRFSRDDVIGEVMVPLSGVDPSTGKVQLTREIIKRNIQKCISRGELQVSLSYQPVAQRMTVVVLKARHLPKMDITGLSGNPYVKVNVYYGRKRIAKKKTHVKKCTLNPIFNESFIYDIPVDLLPDISIEFLVIDFDRTTKNEVVGRLILGAHSITTGGVEHWREVCENPRKQIAKWHSLSEY